MYSANKKVKGQKIMMKKVAKKPTVKEQKISSKSSIMGTMTPMYKNSVTGKVTKGKTRKMTGKTITEKEFNK